VVKRQFGVSTRLYHDRRLSRDHLIEIASHGFEAVEVFATRTHFDYHNPSSVGDLQQWLGEAGLILHGIHAPIAESYVAGRWGPLLSLASADGAARARAVAEAIKALHVARRIPAAVLVVHAGVPRPADPAVTNSREAARRSLDELQREAVPLGVRVTLEVIPNELSRTGSIVHFIETDLDPGEAGICLDFGHAHMEGDLLDAIETVSEHLATADVHDNHRRTDEHLMPFDGTIDWPAALTALQKVGYEGALMFEVTPRGAIRETLARARQARERMEKMMGEH
jgi:sugar phosphate isomerase/epimerase